MLEENGRETVGVGVRYPLDEYGNIACDVATIDVPHVTSRVTYR